MGGVPDSIENDRNFTMANVGIDDDISDSENDTESSPDGTDENVEDVYCDSNVQGTSSDSDNENDVYSDSDVQDNSSDSDENDDNSIISSTSTTGSAVCSYNLEVMNVTSKLYTGANISQHEFTIAFLSMFHQHRLTYSCGSDFLSFVNQVLPSPNLVIESPLSLIEQLVKYNDVTTTHRCCGYCAQRLFDVSTCTRTECKSASLPDSSFIEVHLDKQLQVFFSGNQL